MEKRTGPEIEVRNLTIGYGNKVVLKDLNFQVESGEIFCILGGSGCGKSTLLKHIIGLYAPQKGDILIQGDSIVQADERHRREIMRRFGVTYQGGALFSSMSLAENVALPLEEYTQLSAKEIARTVEEKLRLVDLAGFGNYMPAELSGGMAKRAGLARALALNPKLLFFDEPSAGLDPITSAELDRLLLRLRDGVFTIADRVIMLDKETKSIVADGPPVLLRDTSPNEKVRAFLTRDGLKSDVPREPQITEVS